MFSPSRMEKFTLKAGSIFFSEAFQIIIAEKCNIQIVFCNLTRTFAYAMLCTFAYNDVAKLDLKPHNSLDIVATIINLFF